MGNVGKQSSCWRCLPIHCVQCSGCCWSNPKVYCKSLFSLFHGSLYFLLSFQVNILYSVFFVLSLISAIIFALLRHPFYPETVDRKNYGKLVGSTFKLMFTKKMIALAFVFAYTGIEQSFWTGDEGNRGDVMCCERFSAIYPTCISFTKKLGSNTNALLALNAICTGFGQAFGKKRNLK